MAWLWISVLLKSCERLGDEDPFLGPLVISLTGKVIWLNIQGEL